jgi:polyketide synthase PksL
MSATRIQERLGLRADHPVLMNHVVRGTHVLPGVAYIDLIFQLFEERGEDVTVLELRNLAVYQPLTVAEGSEQSLVIDITASSADEWAITVDALLVDDTPRAVPGMRFATAQVCRTARITFDERIELPSAAEVTQLEQIYRAYRSEGLIHSGLMKSQGRLLATSDALYLDLSLDESSHVHANSVLFHPGLLDAAVVCARGPFLDSPETKGLFLPLSFERFRASALVSAAR